MIELGLEVTMKDIEIEALENGLIDVADLEEKISDGNFLTSAMIFSSFPKVSSTPN